MRWLVSRLAYDGVVSERDRLREQNDRLVEHLTRLDRAAAGLHETPIPNSKAREPLPPELAAIVAGFDDASVRDNVEKGFRAGLKQGLTVPQMLAEMGVEP